MHVVLGLSLKDILDASVTDFGPRVASILLDVERTLPVLPTPMFPDGVVGNKTRALAQVTREEGRVATGLGLQRLELPEHDGPDVLNQIQRIAFRKANASRFQLHVVNEERMKPRHDPLDGGIVAGDRSADVDRSRGEGIWRGHSRTIMTSCLDASDGRTQDPCGTP